MVDTTDSSEQVDAVLQVRRVHQTRQLLDALDSLDYVIQHSSLWRGIDDGSEGTSALFWITNARRKVAKTFKELAIEIALVED